MAQFRSEEDQCLLHALAKVPPSSAIDIHFIQGGRPNLHVRLGISSLLPVALVLYQPSGMSMNNNSLGFPSKCANLGTLLFSPTAHAHERPSVRQVKNQCTGPLARDAQVNELPTEVLMESV